MEHEPNPVRKLGTQRSDPGDARSEWPEQVLTDSRVIHLWDEERVTGRWFAEHEDTFFPIAWDIYFLYGPDAHWGTEPAPLVSSGFTIIGRSSKLRADLLPLLND